MTNLMYRYCIISIILCLSAWCAQANNEVKYVSYSGLGKPADGFYIKYMGTDGGCLPASVTVEQNKNVVVGIVLVYPRSVTLEDIRKSLNGSWGKYERKVKQSNLYVWRSEDMGFVIGVGKDENDAPSLAMRVIGKNK